MTDDDILSLVGRSPVSRSLSPLKKFYRNKTVMVTGGAGTIGSELVRILLDLEVEQVLVVDWWENGLFYLQQELIDSGYTRARFIIADVKTKALDRIFKRYKPEVVIHASAYKHVPLMQTNPVEAFNNNVWGTLNTIERAGHYGVKNFILVSTDKAVNPTNVMGATKRLCEIVMEHQNNDTVFNAVRFGNVIQSNGSVVNTFMKQLAEGKDLTVTHKKITRYFMTRREAVELILLSGTIANNGDIYLLDMGVPVKIYDLAERLIEYFNAKSRIKIIGLRRGEKMFEELGYDSKVMERTSEDKIFVIKKQTLDRNFVVKSLKKTFPKSLAYEIGNSELVWYIRSLGFTLKK